MASGNARNMNIMRSILVALVLSLLGIIGFRYLNNNLEWKPNSNKVTKNTKEIQLKYIPADYENPIDHEDALAILENPRRYRREFDEMVFDMNTSMLRHVAKRMGLSESQRLQVIREYKNNYHTEFRDLYFKDFLAARDTTSSLYETWYDNGAGSSVEVFNEVASKYTCFLTQTVLANIIKTDGGKVLAGGRKLNTPCGIALEEALTPLIKRMKERAAIADFSRSKGMLQEKMEQAVAELATYEFRNKKGLSKQLQTKFLGVSVSSSDVEISAISILKVGFKINDFFDISLDERTGIVTITLPPPTIVSHEVFPRFDKMDIGWLQEVENLDFNENLNILRQEFRREAIEEDQAMEKAKTNAVKVMNTMFAPLVSSAFSKNYKLRVKFQESERPIDRELSPNSGLSN